MSVLKSYSLLTDEVTTIGPGTEDLDQLLQLGEFMAAGREQGVIVFIEGPALQKWADDD